MFFIDLLFNLVLLYVLGLLVGVIPEQTKAYLITAAGLYLVKTFIWLGLRFPLLLPIDRWERNGAPPEAREPALIRAIQHFPYDFTLFYSALVGGYYAAVVVWMVYGAQEISLSPDLLWPGLLFAASTSFGAIAVGIPVNLLLTSRFSQRLSQHQVETFEQVPGKEITLRTKIATICVALAAAPSLLLFSVQTFVQTNGTHREAERMAIAVLARLSEAPDQEFERWALTSETHPFVVSGARTRFFGSETPSPEALRSVESSVGSESDVSRVREQRLRYVVRTAPRGDETVGVVVGVQKPQKNWYALSLVLMLTSIWPLLTAFLVERTIAKPVGVIAEAFHRIVARGRTEEADRVPIYYKDEVGRLAFNANRTIDTLTEARAQIERTARALAHKNRELQEAYRTKGEFLANMSHELRTPLNAIIGFSRLMKRKVGDDLPERQRKNLDLITMSGEQLMTLVNDLLDFEKIEAGKLAFHLEETDLPELLENLEAALRPQAEAAGLTLSFHTREAPARLLTDGDRLRQVLTNLVVNGLKYSDQGEVRLSCRQEDDRVKFEVADRGIGIHPEQIKGIFQPFHQVDGSETRERGGVGLGLAIVSRLVRHLKGTIEVRSVKDEGSVFTVTFPVRDDPALLAPRGDGPSVVVIDDNRDYLESIHHELSEAGYRVHTADSGEKGLELLREVHPSALLLDVVMPGMDGWEVLQKIRQQPEFDDLPVLITSALDDRPVGLDVDFAGWLTKPFEFEDLKRYLPRERDRAAHPDGDDIVIVEDDPQTSALLEQVFEDSGIRAAVCRTESEAIALLDRSLPSVLVLDLHLEEGSGWAVLNHLRAIPESERTRVFVYTASSLDSEERQRLSRSVTRVIPKHGHDSLAELVGSVVRS